MRADEHRTKHDDSRITGQHHEPALRELISLGVSTSSVEFVPDSVSTTRKSVLSLTSRLVRTSEPRQLRIRSLGSGKYSHQVFVIVTR